VSTPLPVEAWSLTLAESGETMKAAGLKPIDTVVSSTAVLIKSKNPTNVDTVELVAARIRGVISRLSALHSKHLLTLSSCTKTRPMPIQCRANKTRSSDENHSRKTSTDCERTGRRWRLGGCQFNG
jgi:hypothetical protein